MMSEAQLDRALSRLLAGEPIDRVCAFYHVSANTLKAAMGAHRVQRWREHRAAMSAKPKKTHNGWRDVRRKKGNPK